MCHGVCMWGSENNEREWVLPLFYHVGPGDETQLMRLGSKCPYLLALTDILRKHFYCVDFISLFRQLVFLSAKENI